MFNLLPASVSITRHSLMGRRALRLLHALFSKLSARDANVHLFRSIRSLTRARLPLQPQAFWMKRCSTLECPIQQEKECKAHFSSSKPEYLICRKQKTTQIQGSATLNPGRITPRQRELSTLLCASSELVFVFPIKSHFHINCNSRE